MTEVIFSVTQMSCSDNISENMDKAESLIRKAANRGAQVVLLQELFMTPYFCKEINHNHFQLAQSVDRHKELASMAMLAKELAVVIPVSFFEKANQAYFNSVQVIDADGTSLGIYRKIHIPDAVGYYEKFYFNPGDTGIKVWKTRYCNIGIGICWDQWFPELARALALKGADVILYPTAIATRVDNDEKAITNRQWQRVMQGHAAANALPVCAANRVGVEKCDSIEMEFFGSSFITDETGAIIAEADTSEEVTLTAAIDLDNVNRSRVSYSFFRDRRPGEYEVLRTLDGSR